ncbi:MAG: hypothetical protein H5T96_09495, partial [Tissierellales bacterium]|nr:hypothetical protein [Tissierellales bacterium]
MKNRLIYALVCPVTNEPHYVGKSTQGMIRPASHLSTSHNEKIREWVNDLKLFGTSPEIRVIEYVPEEIDINGRERYWISKY